MKPGYKVKQKFK